MGHKPADVVDVLYHVRPMSKVNDVDPAESLNQDSVEFQG